MSCFGLQEASHLCPFSLFLAEMGKEMSVPQASAPDTRITGDHRAVWAKMVIYLCWKLGRRDDGDALKEWHLFLQLLI